MGTVGMNKIVWLCAFLFVSLACWGQTKKSDSLQSLLVHHEREEKIKQIAEIEARYESEKKDKTILELESEKSINNLKQLFLLAGLLSVIGIFMPIYFLQKLRNKKIQSLLDEEKSLNLKLHAADELKSRFLTSISHEFRTPLSLILAPIEAKLNSPLLTSEDRESFKLVKRSANRLLSLVNQLQDLSKLEAGEMELHVRKGDINKLVVIIAASFDSLAESKKITLLKNISINFKESWYDADKLEKIINNLLSNAIKFTPPGGTVILTINSLPETPELQIIVSDTGKGIQDEEKPFVFSPFYQSSDITDDGEPRTGLGLSLVHELVKLCGGSIELHSVVDTGTTISVKLPINQDRHFSQTSVDDEAIFKDDISADFLIHEIQMEEEEEESKSREIETSHPESILVVEDNTDLRNFILSILSDHYTTIAARDGEEGFAIAAEQMPDLIVSDVMMPKLDGLELTQKIKTDERTSHIPIVLLTAKADHASRMDGFKTGADDYVAKPFAIDEFLVRVANLIDQRKKLAFKYMKGLSASIAVAPHTPSLDEKFLQRAKQIVQTNIGNSGFGVEQMAHEILLSRAQLFRKLKAITGLSPNEFINDIRLQTAADLIRAKADTLTQISYSVGYSEQSYFAKRFRKKFGVSPSEYNKAIKQEA
jgi:signal transduction histidine kinase/DNA-binding response OmpR family regulator